VKKLESWKINTELNTFDMFPTFQRLCPSIETEAIEKPFVNRFGAL